MTLASGFHVSRMEGARNIRATSQFAAGPGPDPARMKPSTICSGVAPGCGSSGRNRNSGDPASSPAARPGLTGPLTGRPAHAESTRAATTTIADRMPRRRGCERSRARAGHDPPRCSARPVAASIVRTSIGWVSPRSSFAAIDSSPGSTGIGDGAVSRPPCRAA